MSWNEYFMRHVYLAASKSKDRRTKIGAVLVEHRSLISEGFNGFPRSINDDIDARHERPAKYDWTLHAEHNAVLDCALRGVSSWGTTCYTMGLPCNQCAAALIQGNVKHIVIHKQWPNLFHSEKWVKSVAISQEMFDEAEVTIEVFDKELGLKGYLDGQEIAV